MHQIYLCDNNKFSSTYAYVVMPDHLHWLFTLTGEKALADIVKQVKGSSAYLINKNLGRSGPIWQPGYYDHALRREEDLHSICKYILQNPVRAGLTDRPSDYPFSFSILKEFDSRG